MFFFPEHATRAKTDNFYAFVYNGGFYVIFAENLNRKWKSYRISVVGDPRQVDVKALEKYGKVIRLTPVKLFSEK